ncbi:MAG: DUF1456 family protein [Sulfurovum sp.]|nr:DUF1456 family protein [Sulfurovum sp.]
MLISTNEILYRIQKALNLTQKEMLQCFTLAEYAMEEKHLEALLTRRQEKSFELCSYEELGVFLDGLVTFKRGPSPKKDSDAEALELTNNLILKKLRIALAFKEAETEIVFGLAEVELSKQQLSSLFRKESHKNFKPCSDALLMSFLEGLDEFYYDGEEI